MTENYDDYKFDPITLSNGKPKRRPESYWKRPLKWNNAGLWCDNCGRQGVAAPMLGGAHVLRRPRVFCASLADWLDDEVPIAWLADLLKLIHDTPNLDWLLLTKRPENFYGQIQAALWKMEGLSEDDDGDSEDLPATAPGHMFNDWLDGTPPDNVWFGVTVENQEQADKRIPELLKIPARVRFLSCEPLLGSVKLPLTRRVEWAYAGGLNECAHGYAAGIPCQQCSPNGFHWVIAGGESGPKARPMHPDWARSLRDQCQEAGVPFLFREWGEWAPLCGKVETTTIECDGSEYAESYKAACDGLLSRCGHLIRDINKAKDDVTYTGLVRVGKKAAGRMLDGREWNEFPEVGQ